MQVWHELVAAVGKIAGPRVREGATPLDLRVWWLAERVTGSKRGPRPPRSSETDPGLLTVLVLMTLLALVSPGCGDGADAPTGVPKSETVNEHVLQVKAASLIELESLTVEDDKGVTWTFEAAGVLELTPSHLRQHMVLGESVTVTFHRENDTLVIDAITD